MLTKYKIPDTRYLVLNTSAGAVLQDSTRRHVHNQCSHDLITAAAASILLSTVVCAWSFVSLMSHSILDTLQIS